MEQPGTIDISDALEQLNAEIVEVRQGQRKLDERLSYLTTIRAALMVAARQQRPTITNGVAEPV